jgi:hypothetical protein
MLETGKDVHNSVYITARAYRAPEIMLGCPDYDGQIVSEYRFLPFILLLQDVWSFGCILYLATFRKHLFDVRIVLMKPIRTLPLLYCRVKIQWNTFFLLWKSLEHPKWKILKD